MSPDGVHRAGCHSSPNAFDRDCRDLLVPHFRDELYGKEAAVYLAEGDTMTLRYRVLLHRGDEESGKVAEAFSTYAGQDK